MLSAYLVHVALIVNGMGGVGQLARVETWARRCPLAALFVLCFHVVCSFVRSVDRKVVSII